MKERKCGLLQRMLAVLLAAVLTAGMASNAAPASVLAQKGSGVASASGNDVELPEEELEDAGGNDVELPEEEPEDAGGNDVELPEEEPEDVSGNDIKADDMPEMTYAAMAVRDDAAISCSLDGGTTWTGCDAIENVLFNVSGYTSCKNPIIRLNKDITVDGTGAVSLLINNNNVLIDGQGHTIKRGTKTGYLFGNNKQAGTLIFRNVTIDGGAVWDNAGNVENRQNSGFSAGGDAWLIYCAENADAAVILDNGAILQNNHLNNSVFNGAAVMMKSGSLTMKAGAVIRYNTAIGTSGNYGGGSGAVHVDKGASFTMEGGEIYGNYASLSGGAIVNQGSFTLKGGVIRGNVSGNNGGAISAQGDTVISGGEIKDNSAPAGGGIAILSGTTKISGGAVHDNTASLGGGVYDNANMTVSGTAKIQNNSQGNVYLPDSKVITIDAPLTDGAAIGVKTKSAPADGSPVSITGSNGADYSKYFTSDNEKYAIANGNHNVVQLVKAGNVIQEVKPGDNAPETGISTPAEELKDMLLTDEEKGNVQSGTDIKIVLEVKDAESTVKAQDKEQITQALNSHTVGQYLDIDLYKLIGAERRDITETAKKIRIVITVPDSLKNTDNSKTRAFTVIRVHSGSAELLEDLDSSADTITIETDRFSIYAVVYKDTENGSGGNEGGGNGGAGDNKGDNGNNANDNRNNNDSSNNDDSSDQNNTEENDTKPDSLKDNEPKTGDSTTLGLYATLAMIAGFAYLLLYFTDRKRGMTEETKKAIVSRLAGWAKGGGRIRKYLALAAIFILLVYYHSIGRKTCAGWKEIYAE